MANSFTEVCTAMDFSAQLCLCTLGKLKKERKNNNNKKKTNNTETKTPQCDFQVLPLLLMENCTLTVSSLWVSSGLSSVCMMITKAQAFGTTCIASWLITKYPG